jgi:hypothetical protein
LKWNQTLENFKVDSSFILETPNVNKQRTILLIQRQTMNCMELTGWHSPLHENIDFRTLRLRFQIFRNESFDACGLQGSKASPFHHANMSLWTDELGKMASSRLLCCSRLLRLCNLPILAMFVFVILLNSELKSGQEER